LEDYSCALKKARKPIEVVYKFARKGKILATEGLFGGKTIMVLGAVLTLLSLIYTNVLGGGMMPIVTLLFVLCGIVIIGVGYFMWRWESKPWGSAGFGRQTDREPPHHTSHRSNPSNKS
jgi:hypothetical protein